MVRKPSRTKSKRKGPAKTKEEPVIELNSFSNEVLASFAQIYDKEVEIDRLKTKHITPLADDIKEIRTKLKASSNIEPTDLKLGYAIYARNRDTASMETEERDRIQDNLRIVFGALGKGGQLDFMHGLDEAETRRRLQVPTSGEGEKPVYLANDE